MEIFVDSANVEEIRCWIAQGVCDGVTTNPSIMLKDGVLDLREGARRIAEAADGRPVSVEVTSNDPDEMVHQAKEIAGWADNIVIKIPVVNAEGRPCLGVVRRLRSEGVRVNVTAILSFNQVVLAGKAGGTYLSIFGGRVADEGGDVAGLIRAAVAWAERWQMGKVLVGSIRGAIDIQTAATAGAHVITVPPQFLVKMVDHRYSRDTVRGFNQDAARALAEIERRPPKLVRRRAAAR